MEAVRLIKGQEGLTLDKNEIAALLESLCERPFQGDQEGPASAMQAFAHRVERALSDAEQSASLAGQPETQAAESHKADNLSQSSAFASILSATATPAQCHEFQEAARTSGAVRLEAQSALAFVDGVEQSPRAAPAHLVEQVLASAGRVPSRSRPGIWSRLSGSRLRRRRGQLVAACAVMLMAGGLSWSLLRAPAELAADHAVVPAAMSPKGGVPVGDSSPKPAPASAATPASGPAPASVAPAALAPAPGLAASPPPAAQALADPCAPGGFATAQAGAPSRVEPEAAKPALERQPKTAAASAPEPGCSVNAGATEAGRDPQADQGALRAGRPAAKTGRFDRDPAAAATSAPAAPYPGAARPASPAMRPSAIPQPH
jgi:hypothetical protein